MEPKQATERPDPAIGELVVQKGRHAGSRCPLSGPLVFIGRAAGSDIRLNGDGISPLHCLLALTPQGLVARDLNSSSGTRINGKKIVSSPLQPGDVLAIGPMEFRLTSLAPLPTPTTEQAADLASQRDALRLQAAAVVAQQARLEEDEVRVTQQQEALKHHEQQLAAHLEEKRRKLVEVSERVQAERLALQHDRAAYEKQVEKISGDLTQSQRELMEGKHGIDKERRRLKSLHKRLRQRWHRFWLAERRRLDGDRLTLTEQAQLLEERAAQLQHQEEKLQGQRVRFNTLYELGRRQLQESWAKLRVDRQRWKHRRGRERLAMKVRARDLDAHARKLLEAQKLIVQEKQAWDTRKVTLHEELAGLDQRVLNQRRLLEEQRGALAGLVDEAPSPALSLVGGPLARIQSEELVQAEAATEQPILALPPPVATPVASAVPVPAAKKKKGQAAQVPPVVVEAPVDLAEERRRLETSHQGRLDDLQRLAGDLADQRLQVVEQWQRLVMVHQHWQEERTRTAAELDEVAQRLLAQGQTLADREEAQQTVDQALRQRHDELLNLRQQMVAWRARLRAREHVWEGERGQLLAEVQQRETLAEQQLAALVELRRHWEERRQEELTKLRGDHDGLEQAQQLLTKQRLELAQRTATLEEDRRQLAERALALEQLRQEALPQEDKPRAERRLERLRRRWITQQAATLRNLGRERDALKEELQGLAVQQAQVQKRAADLADAEADLSERLAGWEHKQSLAATRQARVQEELHLAAAQRSQAEQQLAKLKDEIERIARTLYDEPDPPRLTWDQAA